MNWISRLIEQPIMNTNDTIFIVLASVGLFILRRLMIQSLFIPLAKKLDITDSIGMKKFYDNCWYVFYYPTMLYVGYRILIDKPFFPWIPGQYFVFPEYKDMVEFPDLRFYYLIQTSFYVQTIVSFLGEFRKKDFFQYCIHHGSTVMLLFFSFMAGQHRIGVNVLFLHDISDIFLHLSKILHYAHTYGRKKWCDIAVYFTFFTFAISFYITRLYIYPVHVIKEALFHPSRWAHVAANYYIKQEPGVNANTLLFINSEKMCTFDYCVSPHHFLIALMIVLVCLHVFWGYLILRMLLDYLLFNTKKDIRSEDDDTVLAHDKVKKASSEKSKKSKTKKEN